MKKPVHYWWRRRFQWGMDYDYVDSACGIEVPIERASEDMSHVTCKRCKRCRM